MLSVFPARTLHRNPRLFAGPIALLVISVATAVTASGYGATWSGFLADSTRLVTGSDVRATFGGEAVTSGPSSVLDSRSYAKLPGVRDVIPVLRQPGTLSDENLTVIGLSAAHANSIVGPTSSVLDVSGLRRALTPNTDPLPGVELPKGATSLTVRVSASAAGTGSASVLTTLWLADAVGDLSPVELKSEKISTTSQHPSASPVTLSVPATGPWRIVAVDATITTTHQLHDFALGIVPATAHSTSGDTALAVRNPADWKEQYSVFNDGVSVPGPAGAIGFTRATLRGGTNTSVRLMPPGTTAVPVVVSRALAEANELRTGNQVDIDGQWGSFTARVAGVVPLVPGVDSQASLIADLRALDNGWLRSSEQVPALHELWIAGSPDGQVEREAAGIGDARITIASGSVSRSFVGGAVTGLWIGAAGSAAFAIVTLIASLASIVRRRTREVGVLRALGMDAREQSAMRRAEITVVLAFGLVLGLLTGALMLAFTVGTLARSSTPEAPAVLALAVRVDALWPLALVGALVLVSILVIGKYLAVIRRSARGAKP